MRAYVVLVECEGRQLDVFVAARSTNAAEMLAWSHDDHFEIVEGRTERCHAPVGVVMSAPGVQAVLPVLAPR